MELNLLQNRADYGYTTFGSVWKKGKVKECNFTLKSETGKVLPMQSRVTAYWPDGSIKWAAHTADAEKMGKQVCLEPIDGNVQAVEEATEIAGIKINKAEDGYYVQTKKLSFMVPTDKKNLFHSLCLEGTLLVQRAYPVLWLEHPLQDTEYLVMKEQRFARGEILSVDLEEEGTLQSVFRYSGVHVETETERRFMPFICRIYVDADSANLKIVYTFFYDGNKDFDFLKGMGIRFEAAFKGRPYDRHILFDTEKGIFHEAAVLLSPSHPKFPKEVFATQLAGKTGAYPSGSDEDNSADRMPLWSDYGICQDSAEHFAIYKRTKKECCFLNCCHGSRSDGVMMAGGENGGLMLGIRDFWKKYPSGLEVQGLDKEVTDCTVWFYSPKAPSFDFRHYDTQSYPYTCYEGYPELGSEPRGIAVTGECTLRVMNKIASAEDIEQFGALVNNPPVYVGNPEYYHEMQAFGYWSLPQTTTKAQRWIEEQLEKAFAFYRDEIEARDWYGLFDYGDIMHTYDSARHVWKYDMGGFAWQNTELVPTYWLWLYFLRTGREDVFSMAEAMTRHCSEVDVYHFGELQGMGSRHNVRHWGCPCKEPRIAMAGHWRFYYYLTGDYRLGEVMEEVKDADLALYHVEHYWEQQKDGNKELVIRSGPDWSSYVANWMTHYERTLDVEYRKKIEQGIRDIAGTPYGFASGPDYGYNPETARLIYRGENENTPNQHLQICMGGPQIWLECARMLEEDTLGQLLENLGGFYLLSPEEKSRITGGKIKNRSFGWPMLASGTIGYTAKRKKDGALARQAWQLFFWEIDTKFETAGFETQIYEMGRNGIPLLEIPEITTNRTAQWCLNAIMCLEFVPEALEKVFAEWESRY